MTDEQWTIVSTLPLREMCEAILDDAPKTSAKELLAFAQALGRTGEGGKALTKAHLTRIRDAWASRGGAAATGVEGDLAPPTLDQARARLHESTTSGDARGANSWARTVKILEEGEAALPPPEDTVDWALLTEPERSALEYLVRKAYGQRLDDASALWWASLFAGLPADVTDVHPAHAPLPDAARPATPKVP